MSTRAYTFHAPPDDTAAEHAVAIKDGISWPALFIPLPWLLWHRLWLALLGWLVFVAVVAWTDRLVGEDPATILAILGQILFALEANNIRRWSLARRGWQDIGGSFGASKEEAEIRFFQGRGATAAPVERSAERRSLVPRIAYQQSSAATQEREVLGLFPEAER